MADTPLLDRMELEKSMGDYQPTISPSDLPNIPYKHLETPYTPLFGGGDKYVSPLTALENSVLSIKGNGQLRGGSIPRSISESVSSRYNMFVPGDYDNEDAYAQGQGWTSKMVNGVGKGLVLTGTTLLQSTFGLANGIVRWIGDGRFASFYDNDLNRYLDEVNSKVEDYLPNYYTNVEKNASWYSPDKLFTANFLWNGIVKNLGFAAGAALSGGIYTNVLKSIPLTSRLFSVGKGAEALAATEEALLAANKSAETYGKLKSLSDKFLGSYSSLNTGGRAVVSGLSTVGEAGFEALHNMNQFRENKIKEYKEANYGLEPLGADLERINAEAENVGNSSFLLNTALLTATNYIQFPKIFNSSYKAEKNTINSLIRETDNVVKDSTGKYISEISSLRFGKLLSTINKVRPYTFSASEAFEEGAQYAVQVGTQDYYNKKYKGEKNISFLESATEGIKQTFGTDEGMENVLIGGISGSLMQARGTFREQKEKTKNTADAISAFNKFNISDFTKATSDSVSRGIAIQEDRERALIQGDIIESKDLEADYIINYLTPRIKYGRFDLVKSDIDEYRILASTEEGFAKLQAEGKALQTDTREAYLQRLTNLESTAENIKSLYQSLSLRYKGLVDQNGKPVYSEEVMDKMIYAATKIADYDKRSLELITGLTDVKDINTIINDIVQGKTESYDLAIKEIDEKTNLTDDQKIDLKKSLEDVTEIALRRKKFVDEYNDIKKNPNKYKEASDVSTEIPEDKKIKIKTKSGEEKSLEVDEYYVAGSKEMKTKEGVVLDKYLTFQVVGKSENGDILIKIADGTIHSIDPTAFENYSIGKYKDLNPNAKFVAKSFDKVFNFKFKGGKEVKGKVVYDRTTKGLFFESIETKKNGKPLYRIPVTRDQFVAKEGYKRAQIWSDSKFSSEEEEIVSQPETQEEKDIKTNLESKIVQRRNIIIELANRTKETLDRVNNKIVSKKEQLEKINKEISELAEFRQKDKYGNTSIITNFNKVLSRSIKGLSQLTSLKQSLENEIADLENYKNELEADIAYFEDFVNNLQELPDDFKEMVADLKEQISNLENLSVSAGTQINQFSKLIDSINDAVKELTSFLKSTFQKFDKDYPDYIKNNFNEMMDNPLYEKVKELKEYIADYTLLQDVQKEISLNGEQIKEINEKIENLYKQIDEIEKEQRAKEKILSAFEDALKKYETQKSEERKLIKSRELFKKFIGTMSNEPQNPIGEDGRNYQPESKKSDLHVVGSTLAVNDGKAHQARANRFGERFHTLPNKDEIKGVIVTMNTEDQLIPGLTYHLTGYDEKTATSKGTEPAVVEEMNKRKEMAKTVIALVMVNESGEIVDEFGQPIPQGENMIDKAIYQLFPTEKLEQVYNQQTKQKETMFRDSTPEEVRESLRQQYAAWREARLSETELPVPQGVDASFGFPEYVKKLNDEGKEVIDYDARNSVESTGMATAASMKEEPLVMVNTTNEEVNNGSVTFNAPKGRVFLKVPGGLIKLFNNKFSAEKAKTIYDVILQVSKNAYNMLDEKLSDEERAAFEDKNNILYRWLRSTLYWGIAKDMQTGERKPAGYNNVWFEEVPNEEGEMITKLFISGKGEGFTFSPSEVEAHKEDIISLLQNLYHNVSATLVSDEKSNWKEPYYEIIGIDKNGNPITRKWDNYQTYLLSAKGRSEEEIPLTTPIQKLSDAKPSNRSGIYFTLTSAPDEYVVPTVSPKAPTATQPTPVEDKGYVFDGVTINTFQSRTLGTLRFTVDAEGNVKPAADENGEFDKDFVKAAEVAAAQKGYPAVPTTETVANNQVTGVDIVVAALQKQMKNVLEQRKTAPVATPVSTTPAPTPTTSVSTDAKADIKRRRQEIKNFKLPNRKQNVVYNDKELSYGEQDKATLDKAFTQIVDLFYEALNNGTYKNIQELDRIQTIKDTSKMEESDREYVLNLIKNRLNAKYDAELAALEGGAKPASVKSAFVLDGKTLNTIEHPSLGKIRFFVDENGKVTLVQDDENDTSAQPIKQFMKMKSFDFNKAVSALTKSVADVIAPQLAAKQIPVDPVAPSTEEEDDEWDNRPRNSGRDDRAYRIEIAQRINRFEGEDWKKVEEFLKKNFPNIPVYRVKNIIKATNGRQAWGMLKDGAIYLYENAEVGTAYHEVFEAVWKMFTDEKERFAILNEFKNRKGTFVDRETGTTLAYKDATDAQIKEQLAEEFRDYVMNGKIPAKPTQGRPFIVKLFMDLANFIKEFFTGKKAQVNTANLFSKIGNGYYKTYIPYETNLSYAKAGIIDIEDADAIEGAEFRIATIPATELHEIIQHMTYSTLTDLTRNNKSLFEIGKVGKVGKEQLYNKLYDEIRELIGYQGTLIEKAIENKEITPEAASTEYNALKQLYKNVKKEWPNIIKKHEEYLSSYNIKFDENDNLAYEEESGKSDYQDARKIDSFRKANAAMKILFATIPLTKKSNDGKNIVKRTAIGTVQTLPMDKAFFTLKSELHNATSLDEMLERLRKFSLQNADYQSLYERLTKSTALTKNIDWKKIENTYDMHLLGAFWKSMKAQDADKKTVFILPGGEVVIGDSSLASAAGVAKHKMFNSFVSTIRNRQNKYVKYDGKEKKYNATTEINNVTLSPKDLNSYITFLQAFNIEFKASDLRRLNDKQLKQFRKAVEGIKNSVSKYKDIVALTRQSTDVDGRLMELGVIKAILEKPEFESTYFNINSERVQTYIGTNLGSNFYDVISKVKNINELENTEFAYLLTDVNSKGSVLLNAMFNISGDNPTGNRNADTEEMMKVGYVEGLINEITGKKKEASKVTSRERLIQEINLNLKGYYLNLVPGDAAIEWMTKIGNHVTKNMLDTGYDDILKIFENYFISEVELSRDGRKIEKVGDRKSTDLRFFKSILGNEHEKIVKYIQSNKNMSGKEIYDNNKKTIDEAVKNFIKEESTDTKELLKQFDVLTYEEGVLTLNDIDIPTEDRNVVGIDKNIELMSINYIIANIEFHKLIYSDPYQYKDELKRIKNFNSPRQQLMNMSNEIRVAMNNVYNKGYDKDDKVGYTDMTKNFFNSTVIADVFSSNDLKGYDSFEETDGGGYISMKANRLYRILSGEWNDEEENQYRYDVAYEKSIKGLDMTPEERKFLGKDGKIDLKKNPNIRSAYTPLKPIVSGNKDDGKNYNDVVLDKFALVPLSFRALHQLNPTSNALKFYDKMQKENVDYAVYGTGRKVGAGAKTRIYNENGEFNTSPFIEVNKIPHSIIGTQAEVPSKDTPKVRQGTQITKLVTMDFLEAGVPIDFMPGKEIDEKFAKWIGLSEEEKLKSPIYKEIKNNQKLLEERIEEGFKVLLSKLGITKTEKGYEITDREKLVKTLKDEIIKREVNENIIEAFEGFKSGDVVIEATPAYQQIRNILYSIADSNIISPKITGGMKVQIPSTMLESVRATGKDGVFKSDVLNFYSKTEDGKKVNVCEIMVGRWFESDKTDDELIKYFNEDPEGQKQIAAIFGVAFRIPTQKQNSIDAFKIKKFLPNSMGDSVVIPSALVKKAGSDFDIDKLSIYFKNVYQDARGNIKMVPFFGYGEEAKKKLIEMYDNGEFLTKDQLQELDRIIEEEKDPLFSKVYDEEGNIVESSENKLFRSIFNVAFTDEEITKDFVKSLTKSNVKQEFIDGLYRKSLENAYIQSLENFITHPDNFERLTLPNSAKELKDLSERIVELTGGKQFDYSSVGSMLNRRSMSSLRQAFISGKYAIGIAATGQTNLAQNQRGNIFVDPTTLKTLPISNDDKKFLGDASIKFEKYNKISVPGKGAVASLSMIKNRAGKYISDVVSQFIDGYVDISKGPWIMDLGAKPNVTGTWLFLAKIGVPIETVGYFMNQPIVRQYLQNLENAGYSWLFNDTMVKEINELYDTDSKIAQDKIPSDDYLIKMMGKSPKDLTPEQLAYQQFILGEFLKYAKMAEHLFIVTQGSNFDTATINDYLLLFKKQKQLEKARTKTIISSVDDILDNSFVGKLSGAMRNIRNAFSEILISDRKSEDPTITSTRDVLEAVLTPHVDMSDRDFVKIAQKAVADLFDWAVQTNTGLNTEIADILLGKEGKLSAAQEVINFATAVKNDESHPLHNNNIIRSIVKVSSEKENTPDNLEILAKGNKVYDQNQVIYGFNEIKTYLKNTGNIELYDKLIKLSVLQSGLPNSPISFTSLIPYEDFKEIYNDTLSVLDKIPNLADFYKLNVFERNNWNNTDVVFFKKAGYLKLKNPFFDYNTGFEKNFIYAKEKEFIPKPLKNAMNKKQIPQVIMVSPYTQEGRSEFIVYSWEDRISQEKKAEMRRKSDFSFMHKGLFKRVYKTDGTPLTFVNDKGFESVVYKMVNAWGYSFKANEFYQKENITDKSSTIAQSSVIDNGFIKANEVEDDVIEKVLSGGTVSQPVVPATQQPIAADEAALKSQIAALEEKKKTIGIGPAESAQLIKLQTELGKIIKSKC